MEFLQIDIENLYTTFVCGAIIGFGLSLAVNLIGTFIRLFTKIIKIGT